MNKENIPNDENTAYCACLNVKYDPEEFDDGKMCERWLCVNCGREFRKVLVLGPSDSDTGVPEFFDQVNELVRAAVRDKELDVMVVARTALGTTYKDEHYVRPDSPPICYRFNEVSTCRTTLIDAVLSLRDCFLEVVQINKKEAQETEADG